MLLVNVEPTDEDKELEETARNILGKYASCFSRIFLSSAYLTEEEDAYPAGPSNMFFKPFLDVSLHQQFRDSTHMFWMEHDVYPLRSGWLDALLAESARGDFWVSGSVYLGDGLDNAVAANPENWNWVGHINGNALYDLKDPLFVEFLRLVIQYEPPSHFWKPFDVSIWRVLHAFPYTWPIYQRYRSKFIYADFIHHWGFHVTEKDVAESIARQEVFLIHGANFSAGNVLVRPKPIPADVVWDDRVLPSARLSIMIRSTADEVDRAFNAAIHACAYVPNALELVVVVPEADTARFKTRFKDDPRTAAVPIVSAGNVPSSLKDTGRSWWVGFHADTYCKGDIILHLSSDEVFNRLLELRDLLWLGRPMMVHRRYSGDGDDAEWAAGTGHFLGVPAATARDFRTPHLHVYPRGLYAGVRRRVEIANGDTPFAKVLEAAERNRTRVSVRNVLGTYGLRFAPELVSPVPMDAADRRRMRLPTPVLIPPFFGAV